MDKYQKEQISVLRRNGQSYTEIAKQIRASRDAVISYCRRNGLQDIGKNIKSDDKADCCRECGKALVQTAGMKRRIFCSKECRVKWWNEHPEKVRRKAIYQYTCPTCGERFSAYGNARRKYCSHACYIADRFGGGTHE